MIEKIQIMVKDFDESFGEMPYESIGRAFMAIMAYAKDDDPMDILGDDVVAKVQFQNLKAHVLRMEDFRLGKSAAGKKGGGQFGNSNAKKTSKNEQKRTKTSRNEQKRTPNPNPNPNPIPNPIPNPNNSPTGNIEKESVKERYGEFDNVLLTIDEFMKLKERFPDYQERIENLSQYMERFPEKAKTYKSHYATILAWSRKDKPEKKSTTQMLDDWLKGVT